MSSRRVSVDVSFERRGRRLLEPGTLVIRDPLALAVREVTASGDDQHQELLVLPCVKPLLSADARGAGADGSVGGPDAGGSRAQLRGRLQRSAAELDIDGLRPYREGTPASRIHWPVVARSGEMVERRLSADADSAPLVVLDATAPPSEEALDRAVRAAASLCVHLARRGGCAAAVRGLGRFAPRAAAAGRERAVEADSPLLRLAAFTALAAFAAGHWATLVADAPTLRLTGAVAAAVAVAAALGALRYADLPRPAVWAIAAAISVAGLALALMSMGLSARLLPPGAWDDLANELDRGLSGIRTVEWPYAGPDESVRLAILLGAPLLLTIAAALSFWPAGRDREQQRGAQE